MSKDGPVLLLFILFSSCVPSIAAADPFEPEHANGVSRQRLGQIDGETLYARSYWSADGSLRVMAKRQIFFVKDNEKDFEKKPSLENEERDGGLKLLPNSKLEIVHEERFMAVNRPSARIALDEKRETVTIEEGEKKTVGWERWTSWKHVYRWNPKSRSLDWVRSDMKVDEFLNLWRLEHAAQTGKWDLFTKRAMTIDAVVAPGGLARCDTRVGMIVLDAIRKRVSIVDPKKRASIVDWARKLSRFDELGTAKLAPDYPAPLCGAFADVSSVYFEPLWRVGESIAVCAEGRLTAPDRDDMDCGKSLGKKMTGQEATDALLSLANLAASVGDDAFARFLTGYQVVNDPAAFFSAQEPLDERDELDRAKAFAHAQWAAGRKPLARAHYRWVELRWGVSGEPVPSIVRDRAEADD